jgi:gliding motility-associated-like protein
MKRLLLFVFTALLSINNFSQTPNYVPSNGLVGWWPFTGNANDSSGNGNNGTVNGATLTADRFGNANQAYTFDGNNDNIFVNRSILNNFTTSIWFYTNQNSSITSLLDANISNWEIYLKNFKPTFANWISLPNNYQEYTSNSTSGQNQWNHLVCTYNSGNLKLYLNGLLTSAFQNVILPINTNGTLFFGASISGTTQYFNGKLDDVGFWNRALTECEIQNLYQSAISLSVDDISICQNGTGTLVAQTLSSGGDYLWNTGSQSSTINVSSPSTNTYYVSYTLNGLTCTDSAVVNIIPNQPAFFPSVDPICAGDPLAPLPTSSLNLFQGTWSPPINNMVTTTYTFNPSLNVCAWDTTTLTVVVKPVPVLTSQDINTCIGQEVNISSTPDLPNGTFSWSNNLTTNQFNITADTTIFYTVTYTLDGCMSETDTLKVVVNTLPLVSITSNGPTTFCAESSVNLTSSYNYGNLWSTSENTQNITATESGTYQVIVTDSNGCVDSASITIINSGVPCLQIGGVFTPNGDGTNDTWQIVGIENYPDATVEIFNRWGQQLFFSKGYTVPWNGTYNNEQLPTGDYFYIIDLGINDPIKGALTIKN